jgi:hypothetical protein
MMATMSTATSHPEITAEFIRNRIARIKWFHQIDLGHGILTPGDGKNRQKLAGFHLPDDLTGKTFLDVGAWDGFFSFEAERCGASRVLATDSYVWQGKVPGYSKAGFLAATDFEFKRAADDSFLSRCGVCLGSLELVWPEYSRGASHVATLRLSPSDRSLQKTFLQAILVGGALHV